MTMYDQSFQLDSAPDPIFGSPGLFEAALRCAHLARLHVGLHVLPGRPAEHQGHCE